VLPFSCICLVPPFLERVDSIIVLLGTPCAVICHAGD
jgi:hypothetical protein